jgi:hypothetical protein
MRLWYHGPGPVDMPIRPDSGAGVSGRVSTALSLQDGSPAGRCRLSSVETIMAVTLIDDYEVMYSSTPFVPRIWLISQGDFIGQLIFLPDGTSLPGDTPGNLYYHLEDFENLLGILATDKPSYLLFVGTGPGNENGILTAPEPVGEGVSI